MVPGIYPQPDPGTMTHPLPLILDGDPGTDDLLTWMWALAVPDRVKVLGICTVHGNVGLSRTTENALALLDHLDAPAIPVHAGEKAPLGRGEPPAGDGAFAESGLGALVLPPATRKPASHDAVGWMADTLRSHPPRSLTICATGPLTNLARLLERAPDAFARIGHLAVMGGSCDLLPPNHGRRGNITEWAEFNFYMDPLAAQQVLNSGIPITLMPLDLTHQLVSTPDRLARARALPRYGEEVALMLDAAAHLDRPKFGADGAFQHDMTVLAHLLHPELFEGEQSQVTVATHGAGAGACLRVPDPAGAVHVVLRAPDPAAFFDRFFQALGEP
jgi:purine nucleosidase